jgi:hypothetical protein
MGTTDATRVSVPAASSAAPKPERLLTGYHVEPAGLAARQHDVRGRMGQAFQLIDVQRSVCQQ